MEIEFTKYENPTRVEGEIELLAELAMLIKSNNVNSIKEKIEENKKSRKSGLFAGIETDIIGFFELDQTLTKSWVLCKKFRDLTRQKVKELLLNRVKSIKEGPFELPEKLFEVRTFRIVMDERLIDVEEVSRRTWDYILYKSLYYKDEYFAHIVFEQSFASWSQDFQLSDEEVAIAKTGVDEEIISMIDNIRQRERRS